MEDESHLSSTHHSSIDLPLRRDHNREQENEMVLLDTMPLPKRTVTIDENLPQNNTNNRNLNESIITSQPSTNTPPSLTPNTSTILSKNQTEPVRTDPQNLLEPRKGKIDRQIEERVPEIHIVGSFQSAENVILDLTEGAMCRWKIEFGKAWQHLGGELIGQTQVSYGKYDISEELIFSHPVDVHFAATGLQGWGAPRITVQSFRLDWYGRRILHGYGFVHLPITSGYYELEVPLWRPVGTSDQELRAYLLGETPALLIPDPIYESAWKDRARLLTTSSGKVKVALFIVTRYFEDQGILQYKTTTVPTAENLKNNQ